MLAALEVSLNFVVTMSHYRDVLATNMAKEKARLCFNICGLVKKMTNITGLPRLLHLVIFFWPNASAGLSHVTFITTCVAGINQSRNSTGRPLLQPAQNISQSCKQQMCVKKKDSLNRRKHHECEEENLLNYETIRGKENNLWQWKQVILTFHCGVKILCPLLSRYRMAKVDQLVTCCVDGCISRMGGKLV